MALVTEQLAAKPERADVVHDLLAFLAEQMTALNQQKRAAAKQFLTDLKDFHSIDAHALKPKTKLDEFAIDKALAARKGRKARRKKK